MIHLDTQVAPYDRCVIHPVVVFSILNHHVRHQEENTRVIGALMGTIYGESRTIEIRDCFPVPHSDIDHLAVNLEHHKSALDLHKKINPNHEIVGWYATGDIPSTTSLIHHFFAKDSQSTSIHLLIDTDLSKGAMSVQTFYSLPITFGGHNGPQEVFIPLANEYVTSNNDITAINAMIHQSYSSSISNVLSELSSIEMTLERLYQILHKLCLYLDKLIDGTLQENPEFGRFLQYTLSRLPANDPLFENMFTNSMQDSLMVAYLANLSQSHLLLAEKLREPTNIIL